LRTRSDALSHIEGRSFDVCVIGGGATGSGCALDAQLRGLKTVQLEARDFASATSSASTKMIHGGVRYLEQAIRELDAKEFKVLTRALHERIHMLRNAPYLTSTRVFLTPCFNWWSVVYFEIGLKLYDWIAGKAGLAPSSFVPRKELLRRMPALNPERLVGAVAYVDGQFDDARYNIALVKTFAEAGGEALNHARVVGFVKDSAGKIKTVEVEDQLSRRRFPVRARAFINATGPFADTVRQLATPGAAPRMRLSKGVHIVLPLDVLPGQDAMLIPRTEDGRVLFAIPWFGRLLVGTTEEEVGVHDDLFLKHGDVEYLLRHLNRYLARPAGPESIVSGSAGARPLVRAASGADTKKLARDHEIELDPRSNLISIMGGKWTTYRAMAEDTVNALQDLLAQPRVLSQTLDRQLVGSEGYSPEYPQTLVKEWQVSELTARHLAQKYGTLAAQVLALAREDQHLAAPLVDGLAPIQAEVIYAARQEMAVSVEDVLARRIGLQLFAWQAAIRAAPAVARLLAQDLRWPKSQEMESVSSYTQMIEGLFQKAGLPA
jgi:glycerol-3-phosphate dehydrogenase